MGSFIQKIFQGRGDKKGKGFGLKRGLLPVCLVLIWLGLLNNFPLKMPALWFSFSAVTALICSALHIARRGNGFGVEFLLSLCLLYSGTVLALQLPQLRLAYFTFIIIISFFYDWKTTVLISLFIPLMYLKSFSAGEASAGEGIFFLLLLITAGLSAMLTGRFKGEKNRAVTALKEIKETALGIAPDTQMESLDSEEATSHYFASILKTDEEIKDLLLIIKKAVLADSVNFFVPQHNSILLRCSTEEKGYIIISGKGIIADCMKEKKPIYSGEAAEKKMEIDYIKKGAISSILAIPVMEGSALLGVLTADSSRYAAFSESDRNTVKMFTNYLLKILERERIYPIIKRDFSALKILKEESSALASSLKTEVIAENLCKGAERIASSLVFFFLPEKGKFALAYSNDSSEGKRPFDFSGTQINFAIENKQYHYGRDVTQYKIPVGPFRSKSARSVLAVPLSYENKLNGLLVMLSEKKDFLDTFQIELLKVMCNQASTSIANANMHAEIERLATTDGLTGLNNHRIFQEKLTEEIKRLGRHSEPTSLLLMDIDFFKKVNDTYGHPIGDLVLKGVAKIVMDTIRDIDIAARYGGEEFSVILPQTDGKGAKNIAERLRKTIMATTFSADSISFKVTLSIGISTAPADARTKEELVEKADQALYHSKHGGRNQTTIWSSIKN